LQKLFVTLLLFSCSLRYSSWTPD